MGYFSNGAEGAMYQEVFCERCIHFKDEGDGRGPGCPVWDAHLFYAYELCNEDDHPGKIMLDMLIPRREDGGYNGNGRCTMFHQDEGKEPLSAWVAENVV
jgi:hypothetical protein